MRRCELDEQPALDLLALPLRLAAHLLLALRGVHRRLARLHVRLRQLPALPFGICHVRLGARLRARCLRLRHFGRRPRLLSALDGGGHLRERLAHDRVLRCQRLPV